MLLCTHFRTFFLLKSKNTRILWDFLFFLLNKGRESTCELLSFGLEKKVFLLKILRKLSLKIQLD